MSGAGDGQHTGEINKVGLPSGFPPSAAPRADSRAQWVQSENPGRGWRLCSTNGPSPRGSRGPLSQKEKPTRSAVWPPVAVKASPGTEATYMMEEIHSVLGGAKEKNKVGKETGNVNGVHDFRGISAIHQQRVFGNIMEE